jgi:hypothetical protein
VSRLVHGCYRQTPEFSALLNTANLYKSWHIFKTLRFGGGGSPAQGSPTEAVALNNLVSCQASSVAAHLPSTRMALLQALPMRRALAAARV